MSHKSDLFTIFIALLFTVCGMLPNRTADARVVVPVPAVLLFPVHTAPTTPQAPNPGSRLAQVITVRARRNSETVRVRSGDEVWKIDATQVCGGSTDLSSLNVQVMLNGQWQCSNLTELAGAHSSQPQRETILFVHGYNTSTTFAELRGVSAYRNLFSCDSNRPPVRFVIFEWNSERRGLRLRRDFTAKLIESVKVGSTLGWILDHFADTDLTLAGYSLGNQVVLSAMTEPSVVQPGPEGYRLILIAPVLNNDFANHHYFDPGYTRSVESTLVFTSERDRAVNVSERFRRRRSRKQYVSLDQFLNSQFGERLNFERIDVTCETGRKHALDEYTSVPAVVQRVNCLIRDCAANNPAPFPFSQVPANDDQNGPGALLSETNPDLEEDAQPDVLFISDSNSADIFLDSAASESDLRTDVFLPESVIADPTAIFETAPAVEPTQFSRPTTLPDFETGSLKGSSILVPAFPQSPTAGPAEFDY